MARTRRTYTREFKLAAVQLITHQGRSVAEAARSLGIGENLLRKWKHDLDAQATRPSRGRDSFLPSRRKCAGSAPRTSGCRWSATF
jgi:transposase